MKDLKLPLIISIAGFFIILIINGINGNSFGVMISRSLFFGSLTFGLVFGIIFLFKNVLGIDFSSVKSEPSESGSEVNSDTDEKGSVDFTIGDSEDASESFYSAGVKEDESGHPEKLKGKNDDEEASSEFSSVERDDADDSGFSEDLSASADFEKEEDFYDGNEPSEDKADNAVSSENLADEIKKKIGVDVSFEDIAKAIRTKINRD